jgi:hypothetical protein
MVGRKTEKSRLRRSIQKITDKMREIRYWSKKDQCFKINESISDIATKRVTDFHRRVIPHAGRTEK